MPAYSANIQGSYVALGDSYSAGEGLRPFVPGTDTPTDDCHRADDKAGDPATGRNPAYATLLESWLPAADRGTFTFHACSGALVNEVLNATDRDFLRIPAQYAGGRDPSVGLVTLTIGGNDAIFSKVVQACLLSDQCMTSTFPPFGIPVAHGSTVKPGPLYATWAPQTIEEIGRHDFTLFTALRADFPNARVIVIGYPYLFPTDAAPRDPFSSPLCSALLTRFNIPQRMQLKKLQDDLNDRTYEEAVAAGVEFVSPDAIWDQHVPCGKQPQYTNSVKPIFSFSTVIDGGSFHPNAAGQRVYAALLACYLDHYPGPRPNAAPDPYRPGHPHSITIPPVSLTPHEDLGLVDPPGQASVPGRGKFSNC
jgi:lysophospholipase L1-like esterase